MTEKNLLTDLQNRHLARREMRKKGLFLGRRNPRLERRPTDSESRWEKRRKCARLLSMYFKISENEIFTTNLASAEQAYKQARNRQFQSSCFVNTFSVSASRRTNAGFKKSRGLCNSSHSKDIWVWIEDYCWRENKVEFRH